MNLAFPEFVLAQVGQSQIVVSCIRARLQFQCLFILLDGSDDVTLLKFEETQQQKCVRILRICLKSALKIRTRCERISRSKGLLSRREVTLCQGTTADLRGDRCRYGN